MSEQNPVVLSKEDLEVLALIEQANQQYQVYFDFMKRQSTLTPKRQSQAAQPRSWDYPLGFVLRSDNHALMERFVERGRGPAGECG